MIRLSIDKEAGSFGDLDRWSHVRFVSAQQHTGEEEGRGDGEVSHKSMRARGDVTKGKIGRASCRERV